MRKLINSLAVLKQYQIYCKIILLMVTFLLIVADTFAQWSPDIRLTNDPAESDMSRNNARCVAVSNDIIHVIWGDYRTGPARRIYYKRSINNGISWEPDVELTHNPAGSGYPSIAVSGSTVHVTWTDVRNGNYDIYYKRSRDNGLHWSSDMQLTTDLGGSRASSLAVSGDFLHVVFLDNRSGNEQIYYKRSTDGGVSWGNDTRISNSAVFLANWICGPSVSASSENVFVVWQDDHDGNLEIYSRRSTNNGERWEAETRLTNNSSSSQTPSVIMSNTSVNVVWQDNRDGNYEIYFMQSNDYGVSWSSEIRLTENNSTSTYPSITISGETIHVFWQDNRDGNPEIYYKQSNDFGINWEPDLRLTDNSALSQYVSSAASDSVVHIVWQDNRDGNLEIYYKKYLIETPSSVEDFNEGHPATFELFQNYPNPFNPSTKIKYSIPQTDNPLLGGARGGLIYVQLKVYDILGREVLTLVNEKKSPGNYEVEFNASNLASGVYFYKLQAGSFVQTKKMILLR